MKLRPIVLSMSLLSAYTHASTVTDACYNCPALDRIEDAQNFNDTSYYQSVIDGINSQLSKDEIKSRITATISQNHRNLTYSQVWTALTKTDEDPTNGDNVILLYKGTSLPKFSNGSGSQSSNPDNWNREHVWAKSHGFSSSSLEAYTDIHHLRPTDISVNGSRGNLDFDNSDAPLAEAPSNRVDGDSFEPRDAVKGDVARMLFYMDTRYEGMDSTPDLELVNRITSNGEPALGMLCRLVEWHLNDPVDAFESNRNNAIYEFQGNRNPFIDHPEWVDILYNANNCDVTGGDGGDSGGDNGGTPTDPGDGDNGGDTGNTGGANLFISEYVEGSSYNKAIELFNPTAGDIDLSAADYKLARYSNGSTSPSFISLTGTIAANGTFVIVEPRATEALLATADMTSGGLSHNGDDAFVLFHGDVAIDSFGRVGEDPGSNWGSDTFKTKDNTLRRIASVTRGDSVIDDSFDPANEWLGAGKDEFSDLGNHVIDKAPLFFSEYIEGSGLNKALELYNPSGSDVDLAAAGYRLERFSNGGTNGFAIALTGIVSAGDVFVIANPGAIAGILDQADMTTDAIAHNGDDAYVLYQNDDIIDVFGRVGEDPGSNWGSGTSKTKDNTLVRLPSVGSGDTTLDDAFDPALEWQGLGNNDTSSIGSHIVEDGETPVDPIGQCFDPATPINQIQGTTFTSPAVDETHIIEAVVTMLNGQSGFFAQEEISDEDANSQTSEAIYVSFSGEQPQVGDLVRVMGRVEEKYGKTQLVVSDAPLLCGTAAVSAQTISLPFSSAEQQESLEGMLVTFDTALTVTDTYYLGRYGEVTLSSERLYVPTNLHAPGSFEATMLAEINQLNKLTLDDNISGQNPADIIYPTGNLSAHNSLRLGDTVSNLAGVLDYSYGKYRLLPTESPDFHFDNARTEYPQLSEAGNLRVASFNVLNYFNGDGNGEGFPTSRGADSLEEFNRQREKVLSALTNMEADIIGILEIENDGFGELSALQDLVNGLNERAPEGVQYNFVKPATETLGGDAIKVALVYNELSVSEIGTPAYLLDFPFEYHNRPPLTQTFRSTETGEKLTVSVNHFRSKGCSSSGGAENEDQQDGQGCYNLRRVQAAEAILAWLATHPTGVEDDDVLIIGDLNAYNQEDPVTTIEQAGFVDLAQAHLGDTSYSYAYQGEIGALDHALASEALSGKVASVTEWHINADEPAVLDYNMEYKSQDKLVSLYSSEPYRASDHDPIIVEINGETPLVAKTKIKEGLKRKRGWTKHKFRVPKDAVSFKVTITGGLGDADLYVRHGKKPNKRKFDCAPRKIGNEEVCEFTNPEPGKWFIRLKGERRFKDVTLKMEALYPERLN